MKPALSVLDGVEPGHLRLRHIADIIAERREPEWLIPNILEAYVLAVLAGRRGSFKSFVALHWAMNIALAGHGVVILSGEGAGLDRRADAWLRSFAPGADPRELRLVAHEVPLNLTLAEVRADVAAAIAGLGWTPALIVVDTASKFSAGLDENENFEVAKFLSDLAVEWRDALRCTVLLVAHAGHADAKRPRGASAWMANPDAEYIVERPDTTAMTCTVSRERFKDTPSLPALAYAAEVYDLGRFDKQGWLVTSLILRDTEAPPPAQGKGATPSQRRLLAALTEWARAHPDAEHVTSIDLSDLMKAQGIKARSSRQDARKFLMDCGYLVASVCGFTLKREELR